MVRQFQIYNRAIAQFRLPVLLCLLVLALPGMAEAAALPRTILALYTSHHEPSIKRTLIHTRAEMPLNHLGLKLWYWDLAKGMPPSDRMREVRGILTWFRPGTKLTDPVGLLKWLDDQIRRGKYFVSMGDLGFTENKEGILTPVKYVNAVLRHLGVRYSNSWVNVTYNKQILDIDFDYMGFERPIAGTLEPYEALEVIDSKLKVLLRVGRVENPETVGVLAAIAGKGGYIAENYACYEHYDDEREYEQRQWFVNPFKFFAAAFRTDDLPKADTTTITGRRIFYSHIDGDGWLNVTEIPKYRIRNTLSSEVILEEVLRRFPSLPVTVAPIAAELDPAWIGSERSQLIAREMFALPYVEPASHTFSHPFYWTFFAKNDPEQERPFLNRYTYGNWAEDSMFDRFKDAVLAPGHAHRAYKVGDVSSDDFPDFEKDGDIPRAYANEKFDLKREIEGAAEYIQQFAPKGKKLKLVQWSGDTLPFEAAIAEADEAGLLNINGGDSRFDSEYHSYAWVSPLGRQVGERLQVYASNSNENTYTNSWTSRFYGFRYLLNTSVNTESPIRIKPLNVYYHMYSGEKEASLNALKNNLLHAQESRMHPIMTSEYAETVLGFVKAEFYALGQHRWRVKHRGDLQTIRFDNQPGYTVDYRHSKGVIGHKLYQDSLYVHLDKSVDVVDIALKKDSDKKSPADVPYLVDANWQVWGLSRDRKGNLAFTSAGFGEGDWVWYMPTYGTYEVRAKTGKDGAFETVKIVNTDTYRTVNYSFPIRHDVPVEFEIIKK